MDIAIIGAGLTGLALAKELKALGHSVIIFEKSRGRGGRLVNKRFNWASLDIGAQYFTVREPAFKTKVDDWQQQGLVTPWQFTPYKMNHGTLTLSPDNTERWVGLPAMNAPAKFLANELNIKFNCSITRIEFQNLKWTLHDQKDKFYPGFDWTIITAPVEQSLPLVTEHAAPPEAITQIKHTPCWALAFQTSTPLANSEIKGIFGDEIIRWVSRDSSKPGRKEKSSSNWIVHFSPEWSKKNQPHQPFKDLTQVEQQHWKQRLIETAQTWLRPCFDSPIAISNSYFHFWRYANLEENDALPFYWADKEKGLALAGAWAAGGRVEGAWKSAMMLLENEFKL
ncbi:NAD(P)/FAD-dependent oxidoreductase [Pleionea sediminis]|uniref:NAD(P)/FAD-dependent oxidoreductase n=1 Tax=Pleionea sediminis TaxID=2569479 RepID=UPI001185CBFE|nr:FAD-dependent oxidoreductase [Pleionea sediminis]